MPNGNPNRNCPQSKGQKCAGGGTYYNTSGRPLTMADLKLCPRNVEYPADETEHNDLNEYNTASDFSESNNSISSTTPSVARGRQFNLEYEIQRMRNEARKRLLAEKVAISSNRPSPPLRIQTTPQPCPNSGVTKNVNCRREATSRGKEFDPKYELQRHQSKSSTCLQQNCRYVTAGRRVDLDRLYDYNIQAHTPPGAAGRPLDIQRDIASRLNSPTTKRQRATSCPTPMKYNSTVSKSAQHQTQAFPQSVSSVYPSLYRTISPDHTIATRTPVKDNSIEARSPLLPAYQNVQGLPPRSVTKTVTTTITRTTTPPHSHPKSSLIRSPSRSPEKSPDRSQRQDDVTYSTLRQDIMKPNDQTYKQTPQRVSAMRPAYKTPPQPSNITTQFPSLSFQRPDNSNISYVPQTTAGYNIFNVPQSESTRLHETIIIPIPPRPNTMITDTILSDVATPNNSSQRRDNVERTGQAYGKTPLRAFPASPAYKTPPQPSKMTNTFDSTSFQMPKSSDISPVVQTPQSAAIHQYESVNIQTHPRPNTLINAIGLPQVVNSTAQPTPPDPYLLSSNISHINNYTSVEQSRRNLLSSSAQNRSNQQPTEQFQSNLYNASMFNEPSALENRRRTECPPTNFEGHRADSTYHNESVDTRSRKSPARPATKHDTRYEYETMDCSGKSPTRTPCPIQQDTRYTNETMDLSVRKSPTGVACPTDNSRNIHYWQIPQEDMSCEEYDDQNPEEELNSRAINRGDLCQVEDMLGPEFESTAYLDLPPPRKPFHPTEKQSEPTSSNAGLFRCVAEKLSATYDFLSSLVTTPQSPKTITLPPARAQQRSRQYCDSTELPASLRECANAKRCGRVQFDSSDKSRVQDPNRRALRRIQIETLVGDNYCPGLIQDTLDGREDFNKHSLNITLNSTTCEEPPADEPMTLLEAFSIRIEKERSQIENQIAEDAAEQQIIDTIETHFANQNPSDLNRSIKSLLLSERIQDHEQVEQAKEKSFEADVEKLITPSPDNHRIKLYFYTGLTKTLDEEPSV